MSKPSDKKSGYGYWLATLMIILFIFTLTFNGRPFLRSIKSLMPYSVFVTWSIALITVFLVVLLAGIYRAGYLRKNSSVTAITILICVYGFLALHVQEPEEVIHYAEFGFLAFFLYRALSCKLSQKASWLLAFVLSSGMGVFEEYIQRFVPNRFSQLSDMTMNVMACLLGLVFTAIVLREKTFSKAKQWN